MNTEEIRNAYLKFFADRGHHIIDSAPLVLSGDPTTLFTGSGMQPMIPYLLGQPHPNGNRIVDSQTCLRAQDIEDIGDNRHTTFFEMLGNWSMGDYFKEQQIEWMFEFLSDVVKLDMSKLYVTCYAGNERLGIAKDTEAAGVWKRLFEARGLSADEAEIGTEAAGYERGIKPDERIFYYDGSKNWWSRNGNEDNTPVGDPCGPDTEMFYDFGTPHNSEFGEHCHPNCDCGRFMEIGNNVFMAYKKVGEGKFEELEQKNVDHGSGLERIAAAKLNDPDVFKISLMWPIIEKLESLSGKKYESHTESMRVIADHLRAATFLAVDGCVPNNKLQGYVMRRLIRRAMVAAFNLGIEQNFVEEIVPIITDMYAKDLPRVADKREEAITVITKEEKAFRQTLRKGLSFLLKAGKESNGVREVSGEEVFMAYDTHGYPPELTAELIAINPPVTEEELASVNKLSMVKLASDWREQFDAKMKEQRERSQTAAKGTFKGGLGGSSIDHLKLHTATHLMYAAMKKIINPDITQHGSNVTEERLRFDFNNDSKVPRETLDEIEKQVNEWIDADLPVGFKEYPTEDAFTMGAAGAFGDKYGDVVKVYQIGTDDNRISFEICGGPHVDHTGQLGEGSKRFKIQKEESSSAGIRRIKAVLV